MKHLVQQLHLHPPLQHGPRTDPSSRPHSLKLKPRHNSSQDPDRHASRKLYRFPLEIKRCVAPGLPQPTPLSGVGANIPANSTLITAVLYRSVTEPGITGQFTASTRSNMSVEAVTGMTTAGTRIYGI